MLQNQQFPIPDTRPPIEVVSPVNPTESPLNIPPKPLFTVDAVFFIVFPNPVIAESRPSLNTGQVLLQKLVLQTRKCIASKPLCASPFAPSIPLLIPLSNALTPLLPASNPKSNALEIPSKRHF